MSLKWIGCVVLPLFSACASTGWLLGARPVRGPLPRPADMDSGLAAARVAIDSAARRGDASALARYLTDDAVVVVGGDTLRGSPAVAAFYRSMRPRAVEGRIEFRPNRTELCTDGAMELGGTMLLVTRNSDGRADTLQPNYAVRWVRDSTGAWRIAAITLQSQAEIRAVAAGGRCQSYLGLARFPRKRLLLTIQMPFTPTQTPTLESVRDLFAARGYSIPGPRQPADELSGITGYYPADKESPPLSAGVRVRVAGPITAEVVGSVLRNRVSVTAADIPSESYVAIDARQRAIGALVGIEWRRLRLAAGPVSVRTSGSLVERTLRYFTAFGGFWGGPLRTDEQWSSSAIGWMGLAAYTWPFSASLFVELRASWQAVRPHLNSSSTVFPSARLNSSGYAIALSLGVAP
jgi:ketosteroid isomerase-like protein